MMPYWLLVLPSPTTVLPVICREYFVRAEVAEIAWPQFKPGEMEDLVAFVKQKADSNKAGE